MPKDGQSGATSVRVGYWGTWKRPGCDWWLVDCQENDFVPYKCIFLVQDIQNQRSPLSFNLLGNKKGLEEAREQALCAFMSFQGFSNLFIIVVI